MSQPEIVLHYFNTRALAEPIRMILAFSGVPYKDERIPKTDPPTPIPADLKAQCPFGQVPLLFVDGKPLGQSVTIARYLARRFNLVGKDEWEAAKCDEIVDAVRDYIRVWFPSHQEKDPEKKAELQAEAIKITKERYVSKFNEILVKNGGKYLVGSSLTWADIVIAHFLPHGAMVNNVQFLDEAPELAALIDTVLNTPGIKEYIASRPESKY